MPVSIIFNQILAINLNVNSTIASGQNNQADWSFQGKNIFAAGQPIGLAAFNGNLNVVIDNDVVDVPINASELNNPQPNIQM